jgi:glycosyltransferase involved in cell wall biosynthesis
MLLAAWSRRSEYDVAIVDVFSGTAFLWAEAVCALLRRLRKPHVVVLRGGGLPGFARGREDRVRRVLGGAAAAVAPSRYLQEEMTVYRSDIALIPNALELGAYPFRLREAARPRLVWLRTFHRVYDPVVAVDVVSLLAREFPDVSLLMVGRDKGDGSLQAAREQARRLGVEGRVSFSDGVPKAAVPEWLNRGDIYLNTPAVDNTPVTVMEAMACGLAVVSTDVGGIPYLLDADEDALLVPSHDPDAMAGAVARILREPGLARRLSRSARAKAERFDWPAVLPQWEALIDGAASSERAPRMRPNG